MHFRSFVYATNYNVAVTKMFVTITCDGFCIAMMDFVQVAKHFHCGHFKPRKISISGNPTCGAPPSSSVFNDNDYDDSIAALR